MLGNEVFSTTTVHCKSYCLKIKDGTDWLLLFFQEMDILILEPFFLFIIIKTTTKTNIIYITTYHSQRERTQGYHAPIANGTYNSIMISNNNKNTIIKYNI